MGKENSFYITRARSNDYTAQVEMDNKSAVYLHSMVNPQQEAEEWVKRLELLPSTMYIVLGAGMGYHLKPLMEQLPPDSHIMVVYTENEIALLKYTSDLSTNKWLLESGMSFLPLMNVFDLAVVIADSMIDKGIKRTHLCRHFPTMALADEEYRMLEKDLIGEIENTMSVNFNVKFTTDYSYFKNFWFNFPSIINSPAVNSLAGVFADVSVIIVAAGPSLDKNIEELKKCVGKAVIIAAGTALGPLYKHGIKPDFLLVIDAKDIMYDAIKDFLSPETILIASTTVQHQVVKNYPGKVGFINTSSGSEMVGEFECYIPDNPDIIQTISVATSCVDFANACGARRIILVGQDLSFADVNKQHADGFGGIVGNYGTLEQVKVPGYYGGEVGSNVAFVSIIEYYKQYVLRHPDIEFINATEGGAMLTHMRNLPLHVVHQMFLTTELDVHGMIDLHWDKKTVPCDYQSVIKRLYKMRSRCEKLTKLILRFCENNNITLNYLETVVQPLNSNVFEILYDNIRGNSGYPYVKSMVDMNLKLLKFQIQDDMPGEMQYEYYINMTVLLQKNIEELVTWTDTNISEIKKISTEVKYERKE